MHLRFYKKNSIFTKKSLFLQKNLQFETRILFTPDELLPYCSRSGGEKILQLAWSLINAMNELEPQQKESTKCLPVGLLPTNKPQEVAGDKHSKNKPQEVLGEKDLVNTQEKINVEEGSTNKNEEVEEKSEGQ